MSERVQQFAWEVSEIGKEFSQMVSMAIDKRREANHITPSEKRLYWGYELKDYSASMYKTCTLLRDMVDDSISSGTQNKGIANLVHSRIDWLPNDIVARLTISFEEIQDDQEFWHLSLSACVMRSPISNIPTHTKQVAAVSKLDRKYLKKPQILLSLLGHAGKIAQGIEYFSDKGLNMMIPAIKAEYVEGVVPQSFLDESQFHFTGILNCIFKEINGTYSVGMFTSTSMMMRRLLENLLFSILQRKYSDSDSSVYLKDKHPLSFFELIKQLMIEKRGDFIPLFSATDSDMLDNTKDLLHQLRMKLNVHVHQMGAIPTGDWLTDLRRDYENSLNFLKHIYDQL